MDQPICGRFAPSPTGRMHLGNAFCALLAWLFAKKAGGRVVLRLEDLDPARSRREYARLLEDDLVWLGLFWDEGGAAGGPHAPYFQSECAALYAGVLARLAEKAEVYPCFCSRGELHAAGAPHAADGTFRYAGTCYGLSPAEAAARAARKPPALRIHVPDREIAFADGLCGPQRENLRRTCGDFILRRADGVFAYQLAVVADDIRMGITQVVRGRDLLSSTARQLWLYELLEAPPPQFIHVPLLLAPDGRRLSKRERDLDMDALRRRFAPEELLGQLAFLAALTDSPAPVSARELLGADLSRIPRGDITVPPALLA